MGDHKKMYIRMLTILKENMSENMLYVNLSSFVSHKMQDHYNVIVKS